jgi:hypothetical protein
MHWRKRNEFVLQKLPPQAQRATLPYLQMINAPLAQAGNLCELVISRPEGCAQHERNQMNDLSFTGLLMGGPVIAPAKTPEKVASEKRQAVLDLVAKHGPISAVNVRRHLGGNPQNILLSLYGEGKVVRTESNIARGVNHKPVWEYSLAKVAK